MVEATWEVERSLIGERETVEKAYSFCCILPEVFVGAAGVMTSERSNPLPSVQTSGGCYALQGWKYCGGGSSTSTAGVEGGDCVA